MLVSFVVLTSCVSQDFQRGAQPVEYSDDVLEARVSYWDSDALNARYGSRLNPFVAPSIGARGVEFIVFDVDLNTLQGTLQRDEIELDFGDRRVLAMNPSQLALYWRDLSIYQRAAAAEQSELVRLVRDEPATRANHFGTRLQGLLVFRMTRPPARGPATVTFLTLTEQGRRRSRVRVLFE